MQRLFWISTTGVLATACGIYLLAEYVRHHPEAVSIRPPTSPRSVEPPTTTVGALYDPQEPRRLPDLSQATPLVESGILQAHYSPTVEPPTTPLQIHDGETGEPPLAPLY